MSNVIVKLYTNISNEIKDFLTRFYSEKDSIENIGEFYKENLEWQKKYQNPTEVVDIIGTFIENNDKYHINMWLSLDNGIFINITNLNANEIIKYIYERYPW